MAPEVINSTNYDYKCDLYSYGIILFQILTQFEDNKIYPEEKLNGANFEFKLASDPNFRPVIPEIYISNDDYKEYIGLIL
jgi:serine/threonine protein kinase